MRVGWYKGHVLKPETAKWNHRLPNQMTETTETSEAKPQKRPKWTKQPKRNKRKRNHRNSRNKAPKQNCQNEQNHQNEAAKTPKARKFPNRELGDTTKLCCYRFGECGDLEMAWFLFSHPPSPKSPAVSKMFN